MEPQPLLAHRLLPWQAERGRSFVTLVVEMCFSLDRLEPIAPPAIGDEDLVPYKPLVDIVVRGRPKASPTPSWVGLALARGIDPLLSKSRLLRVPSEALAKAFDTVAQSHGSPPQAGAELVIAKSFDARGFQAAPPDQWISELRGGEQVRLLGFEGLDGDHRLRVPRLTPRAVVRDMRGGLSPVPLVADTLRIDIDAGKLSILFRGAFEVQEPGGTPPLGPFDGELAVHPTVDDGSWLGSPPGWTQSRHAGRRIVSPVVDRFALENATGFVALARTWHYRRDDMRRIVFVKGSFDISADGCGLELGKTQAPLEGDRVDESGRLEHASDFAPMKSRVDLVVRGPRLPDAQREHRRVTVSLAARHAAFDVGPGEPVRLGPIGATDPDRLALLGSFDRAWREERWPYFPANWDPEAFQCAASELQFPTVREGERLVATGLLPGGASIDVRLPNQRPRGFALERPSAAAKEVPLTLDTIVLDAEAMKLQLVWRGSYAWAEPEGGALSKLVLVDAIGPETGTDHVDRAIANARVAGWDPAEVSTVDAATPRPLEEAFTRWERLAKDLSQMRKLRSVSSPQPPPRATILAELGEGRSFSGRDLSRVDLRGADLRGARLSGAILRGAKLDGARLDEADLCGAMLSMASLHGASLERAFLDRADLRAVDAEGVCFRGASIELAVFTRAKLRDATFEDARGRSASFVEAELERSRFVGAKLPNADFTQAKLDEAQLSGAQLGDARFYEASASGANLDGASVVDARWELATLKGASLRKLLGDGSTWDAADLSQACLAGASLEGAVFSAARLVGSQLERVRAAGASFRAADLRGADLRHAALTGASFEEALLDGARLEGADLRFSELERASRTGAQTDGARLTGTKWERPAK